MKVALDVMGGDRAPEVNLAGAAASLADFPSLQKLFLVGDEAAIRSGAPAHGLRLDDPRIEIVPSTEVIAMCEAGATAIRRKKQSSISIAMDLVKSGQADAFVSAGNTGACVAAAQIKLRLIPGIERAGIASGLPNEHGTCHLLDAGANPEAKPSHLLGYAIMGAAFSRGVYGVKNPKVGIMSNGEEDEKGTPFTKETFALVKDFAATGKAPFEFIGNVEGHDLFDEELHVCLCDGFTGNIVLKTAEATAKAMSKWLRQALTASPVRKAGALLAKGAFGELKQRASAESYGGSPLLGVNGVVIIAHGGSTAVAIRNAIRVGLESAEQKVNDHIRQALAALDTESAA
ncbi:glycerol-3-phosphate acyltransferase PlsX [Haloferula luteola]|uniref:Phosphate acyltransferase n=1 Tax=Haloferula luteola TaxID=595692 RepID=A0A840UYS8_9BACT|nr:phosphate acyltransferase PlsX [Haloferula luteola]MBB5350163.1 glycerol-3-phosphate acyltransferase PlsX [Haloferula luteola]